MPDGGTAPVCATYQTEAVGVRHYFLATNEGKKTTNAFTAT
jgi:hypothetical protein